MFFLNQEKNLISQYAYDPSKTYFYYNKSLKRDRFIYKNAPTVDSEKKKDSELIIKTQ